MQNIARNVEDIQRRFKELENSRIQTNNIVSNQPEDHFSFKENQQWPQKETLGFEEIDEI